MPVLSPHRSSSSGTYRSSFSGSIDRPYYTSSSYAPRINYSERISTHSYTDADGRRIYTRSGSITEDGITTRFKEETTHENSVRRDSISRDSGISSIRENSIAEYPRRESSLTRDSGRHLSSVNVIDSVAELRNRYSPANYVPACHRKNENIARSKSINDIGLPPIEGKAVKKKVINDSLNYNNSTGLNSNRTNNDNMDGEDDNGNRTASVADLRKKFDDKPVKVTKNSSPPIETPQKISENIFKKQDLDTKTKTTGPMTSTAGRPEKVVKKAIAGDAKSLKKSKESGKSGSKSSLNGSVGPSDRATNGLSNGDVDKTDVRDKLPTVNGFKEEGKSDPSDGKTNGLDGSESERDDVGAASKTSRVNNYASFYPAKSFQNQNEVVTNGGSYRDSDGEENDENGVVSSKAGYDNDISPKLNRSTVSPTGTSTVGSSGGAAGGGSYPRHSLERDRNAYNSNSSSSVKEDDRERDYPAYDKIIAGGAYDRNYDRLYDRSERVGPSSGGIKSQGLNGLKNIGNTCFMNSVIQCLSNTRLLLEYVKKDGYLKDVNTSFSSMKGALIKSFAEVIKELWSEDSSDRVVNTVSLKSQIQRFAPRFMGYAQQDAQEFLRYLLEGLHEDVNRVVEKPKAILTEIDEKLSDSDKSKESWQRYLRMDNSRIVDIFVGQLKSTLRCTHCGHASVTFDPFWDLSLPIPQRTGQLRLGQCLESFTREETLDGDEKPTCSKCKERRKCTKSFSIQKFPKILVIHLKRFSPTERFRGKLSVTVDFPLEGLDMSAYAAESVAPPRYNLYAVSNHSGTTYSGHYTAYCRHPYSLAWHEYNDSRVSTISAKSVVSSEAYVLFYELDGQKSHL